MSMNCRHCGQPVPSKDSLKPGFMVVSRLPGEGLNDHYRAVERDSGREVAVRFVAPDVCSNASKALDQARWEAVVLAHVEHPNIVALYRVEEISTTSAVVSELVDGVSLAERLLQGPLTLAEASFVFGRVAAGLAAAHRQGIVHCNLKPKNILISTHGETKIQDFRRAILRRGDNETKSRSRCGVGAPAYMSPEQARGDLIDERSDVWAFGCCLFESLAGRRPFVGTTLAEISRAARETEPDYSFLPTETPHHIRSLLERCLEKDHSLRLQSMSDIALWLGGRH
jgi:eukaryotic-like serine/threonine-protein kinase